LLGRVGVEVTVAATSDTERYVDVEPQRSITQLGERGLGQGAGGRYGFTIESYGRHTSSVTDPVQRSRHPFPRTSGWPPSPPDMEICVTGTVKVLAGNGSDLGLGEGPSPVGSKAPPRYYLSRSPPPPPSGCLEGQLTPPRRKDVACPPPSPPPATRRNRPATSSGPRWPATPLPSPDCPSGGSSSGPSSTNSWGSVFPLRPKEHG